LLNTIAIAEFSNNNFLVSTCTDEFLSAFDAGHRLHLSFESIVKHIPCALQLVFEDAGFVLYQEAGLLPSDES
jgi:hypothetical protein